MKINVNQVYKSLEGEVVKQEVDGKAIEMTLKISAITALLTPIGNEEISGEEKATRFLLAERLTHDEAGVVDLKSEEVALLKKLIGVLYSPLIVGQAFRFLEQD